jgi:arylsulfatase A-like enzyme/Flp pilus assembly protein TadD
MASKRRVAPRRAPGSRPASGWSRTILLLSLLLAALAAAVWLLRGAVLPQTVRADGPIVLISIDTLRADRLPVYGYGRISTAAINRLAADGVVFERAYAHAPLTLPSHASMFSGRLPFEHGVRDNLGFAVDEDERLMAVLLRDAGYATGGAVSAYVLRRDTGIARGFDLWDDQFDAVSPEAQLGAVQRDGAESVARLRTWIAQQANPRFFAFLHLFEPHAPYTPPARHAQADPYDGEVAYADELVGRFLDHLDALGLYDRATIILLSDHGEGLGDHGEQGHGVFLYDEIVRVPLIVKLPGGAAAGRRVPDPVQHIDLLPTVLDLAGLPRLADVRGRSLAPLLRPDAGTIPEQGVYAESLYPRFHFGWSELYSLTDERYRYIRAPREELYDLRTDPGERHNLAAERTTAAVALRGALDALLAGADIDRPAVVAEDTRERLQALGYISAQAEIPRDATDLPDPKDRIAALEGLHRAQALVGERRFGDAIRLLQGLVSEDEGMAEVWDMLGLLLLRVERVDEAVAALQRVAALRPTTPAAMTNVAAAQLKAGDLDQAQAHAELAVELARDDEPRWRATAYEMLARVALARNDSAAALRAADLAQQADPTLPLPAYVRGLVAHADRRFADALPHFQDAARQAAGRSLAMPELHYHLADTLGNLEQYPEAERHFLEEIRVSPANFRARASLALLYRAMGRDADAERTLAGLLDVAPTPGGYGLAAQVWDIVGESQRAAELRAAGRRRFAGDPALPLLARP